MSEKREERQFICLGSAHMKGDTKGVGIQLLDDNGNPEGEPMYYKKLTGIYPGLLYSAEFTFKDGGASTMHGGATYEGQHPDEELTAAIKIQSAATDTALAVIRREKKANNDKEDIFACLGVLRKAYHGTNYQGKLALEVQVLDYIRRKL